MAQILRIHNANVIHLVLRSYGIQRQLTYYEILNISPNSTQKEIKQAFIKLSKKIHPDVSGKEGSHNDFVKINEAYSVLSKESTRRQYDLQLKYHSASFGRYTMHDRYRHPMDNPYDTIIRKSRSEWEESMTRGARRGNPVNSILRSWLTIWLISIGLAMIFQLSFMSRWSMFHRQRLLERSEEYKRAYEEMREPLKDMTFEEQIQNIKDRTQAYQKEYKNHDTDWEE